MRSVAQRRSLRQWLRLFSNSLRLHRPTQLHQAPFECGGANTRLTKTARVRQTHRPRMQYVSHQLHTERDWCRSVLTEVATTRRTEAGTAEGTVPGFLFAQGSVF